MSLLHSFFGATSVINDLQKARNFCSSEAGANTVPCKINQPESPSTLLPIGGYVGYVNNYTVADADHTPANAAQLITALDTALDGEVIWLDPDTEYDFSGLHIPVRNSVIIASDRGVHGSPGALIKNDTGYPESLNGTAALPVSAKGGTTQIRNKSGDAQMSYDTRLGSFNSRTITSYVAHPTLPDTTRVTLSGSHNFRAGDKIGIWGGTGSDGSGNESDYNGFHSIVNWVNDGTARLDLAMTTTFTGTPTGSMGLKINILDDGTYNGSYAHDSNGADTELDGKRFFLLRDTATGNKKAYTSDKDGTFFCETNGTLYVLADNVIFEGVRLKGFQAFPGFNLTAAVATGADSFDVQGCIYAFSNGLIVRNCEIYNFNKYGIHATFESENVIIEYNHIHNCQLSGYGYGMWLVTNLAVAKEDIPDVQYNIFTNNRHSIASTGGSSNDGSYNAYGNIVNEHYHVGSSFNVHRNGPRYMNCQRNVTRFRHTHALYGWELNDPDPSKFNVIELNVNNNYFYQDTKPQAIWQPNFTRPAGFDDSNNVYDFSSLDVDSPIVQISVDNVVSTSPSGDITFTAIASDPNGLPITSYYWTYGGKNFYLEWTDTNTFTITGITTGIYVMHVVARNAVGYLSRPSSVTFEVSSYAITSIKHKLVAFYDFAGDLTDAHDFGHNLTDSTATAVTYGLNKDLEANEAAVFAGGLSGAFIDPNDAHMFFPFEDSMTINFCLRLNSLPAEDEYFGVYKAGGGDDKTEGFRVNLRNLGGSVVLAFDFVDGFSNPNTTVTTAITTANWYFISIIYDRDAGLVIVKVDNSTVKTLDISASEKNAYGYDTFEISHNHNLENTRLDGRIDNFSVWRRRLSDEELGIIYNGGLYKKYSQL